MSDIETRLDRLESLVEDQQDRIEHQQSTIEAQQETIDAQRDRLEAVEDDDGPSLPISRRRALQAGGALGLLGLGTGTASAAGSGEIGTSGTPVETLYTDTLNGGVTGGSDISNLVGWGLEIYGPGNLRVDWGAANDLDGSGGIQSNDLLRLTTRTGEFDTLSGNIVGGHPSNTINANEAAVIAGGGGDDTSSHLIDANGEYGTIGGGANNEVDGRGATIPGGEANEASADYSFAVGQAAKARHAGAFIVGDSNTGEIVSTRADQARFQMNVGASAFELLVDQGDPGSGDLDVGEGLLYVNNGDLKFAFAYDDGGTTVVDTVVVATTTLPV